VLTRGKTEKEGEREGGREGGKEGGTYASVEMETRSSSAAKSQKMAYTEKMVKMV